MDEVRRALYEKLTGTPAVTGLLSAPDQVWHQRAPVDALPPFVVFHRQSGTRDWTYRLHTRPQLWLVKAVDRGGSASQAEAIDAAVEAALNDAALTVTGQSLLVLRRGSDVEFDEPDGGETFHHVGGLYRLVTQPL